MSGRSAIHGRPRILSEAEETQIRKLHKLGLDMETIGQRFGVAASTIRSRIRPANRAHHPGGSYAHVAPLRMIVTPWFRDPADGFPTRIVRAAE